jgi:hypothetical protein
MSNFIRDTITCKQCKNINEYSDLECLEDKYKCKFCSFFNPNEKRSANIIEYAKNIVPININYEILENVILVQEQDVLNYFNCSVADLSGLCKKKYLSRKKRKGVWEYDWISIDKNYNNITVLLSPNLWYSSKQAHGYLNISLSRISTLRKNGNIESNHIRSRYYYQVDSLHAIKVKLDWPMKDVIMSRLRISEYQFNKMIKSNKYSVEKIANRWHINL